MTIDVHITGNVGPRGHRLELAYIRFSKAKVARTDELDTDRLLAHFDRDGNLVSIEVLAPFKMIQLKTLVTRQQFAEIERVLPPVLRAA
jgi:uncharacterized protein YuzE